MNGIQSFSERFQQLADSQKELMSEAERELSVWKGALRTRDEEVTALKNELAAMKVAKNDSDSTNPLLLCLIDGDGCIFNKDLLMLGTEGGRDAASKLRQHIIAHHGSTTDLLVHVFFNREGLGKTLKSYLGIQPATFSAFINGFNTASPLMSMLDVGVGKEAADAKIRELMRIFVRYPHVKKIYFGGGHDNGYTTNLTTIQNEGYLDKIVLLQSYSQLAAEIKALALPRLENNGVFLAEKLSAKSANTSSGAGLGVGGGGANAPGMNRSKSGSKTVPGTPIPQTPSMSSSAPEPAPSPIKVAGARNLRANISVLKALKPRACNHHYLTKKGCPMGSICPYGHGYTFTPDMLADLREIVKQNPCLLMNKGQECTDSECPSAHQCPQGPNCGWHKQGTCKFTAAGMHGSPVSSDEDDRVLLAQRMQPLSLHARTGSSSSSAIDFGYTSPSPGKSKAKPRGASSTGLGATKTAFKNSISGSTQRERLMQMGVGNGGLFYAEDISAEEEWDNMGAGVGRNGRSQRFKIVD